MKFQIMCGRAYETYTEEELELRYQTHRWRRNRLGWRPTYNLAPTQLSPIVLIENGEIRLDLFRWGLVPSWAKDLKDTARYSLINAKAEEIAEKRSYREAFRSRRCIVPVTGFFEWQASGKGPKRPFAVHLRDQPIMSLAGVWEHWRAKDASQEIYSFSIITCSANSLMEQIHHRMPVILEKKSETFWLDPDNRDVESLKACLKPCPPKWLEAYEISTLVNSPRNNSKEVLESTGASLSAIPRVRNNL